MANGDHLPNVRAALLGGVLDRDGDDKHIVGGSSGPSSGHGVAVVVVVVCVSVCVCGGAHSGDGPPRPGEDDVAEAVLHVPVWLSEIRGCITHIATGAAQDSESTRVVVGFLVLLYL